MAIETNLTKKHTKDVAKEAKDKEAKDKATDLSKAKAEKGHLEDEILAGKREIPMTNFETNHGRNHGRHQQKGKAKENHNTKQQHHSTLKAFGVKYIRSSVTLQNGASIIRTAQVESQF